VECRSKEKELGVVPGEIGIKEICRYQSGIINFLDIIKKRLNPYQERYRPASGSSSLASEDLYGYLHISSKSE
jgi:hypothetical protein